MSDYIIQVGDTEIAATSSTPGVAAYNLTCDVIRRTKTNTARGVTETTVAVVSAMPCGIKWLTGKELLKFNKETHVLDAVLSCRVPAGVVITVADRILCDGTTYEITNVEDVNNLGTLLRIGIAKNG